MTRQEIICELAEYARDNEMHYQHLLFMYGDYTDNELFTEYKERYGDIPDEDYD